MQEDKKVKMEEAKKQIKLIEKKQQSIKYTQMVLVLIQFGLLFTQPLMQKNMMIPISLLAMVVCTLTVIHTNLTSQIRKIVADVAEKI